MADGMGGSGNGAHWVTRREGKRQVSENTVGKLRGLAVSVPKPGRPGQKDAAEHTSALKNWLELPFAKRLAPTRV